MQQKYIDRLPLLLLRYQFIEEALKMYIWRADVLIHLSMKDKVYYRGLAVKGLWKLPLGSLIEEFERRNERDELIKRLRDIQAERNFFAHKGYLISHDEKEEDIKTLLERLENGLETSTACMKDIIAETCKMTGEAVPTMLDKIT